MQQENTFSNTAWEERVFTEQNDFPRHSSVEATNDFTGVIAGNGIVRYTMFYETGETGRFIGMQILNGSIDGRQGSFTVREEGSWEGTSIAGAMTVIEGSGTGDLVGITGSGEYSYTGGENMACAYSFDYQLNNA